jgi:hypothetical protein
MAFSMQWPLKSIMFDHYCLLVGKIVCLNQGFSANATEPPFYFLPPYSPDLNRIEILWYKMKYEWLPFKSFTPVELEQAIDEITVGFGSQYQLTFC